MEILTSYKQFSKRLNELFGDGLFDENDESFISINIEDNVIQNKAVHILDLSQKKLELDNLSNLIFQLKDYMPALGNLTKTLLYSKNYDAVYTFVTRLFVSHIGTITYQSSQSTNMMERYFDRFIEIVKNCNISYELYIPLLLESLNPARTGGLALWRNPSVEYLQSFFNTNEALAKHFLKENRVLKYEILEAICSYNTPLGITLLIEDYIANEDINKEETIHILKKFKRDTFMIIDKMLVDADVQVKKCLVELLCKFDNDVESISRLNELYLKERNEEIKEIIATKIGVVESLSVKNEKQYIFAVRKNVTEPQERSLNVGFDKLPLTYKSGYETDNAGKTFLTYLFKQEKNLYNLPKLLTLKEIFEEEDLVNFAYKLWSVLKNKQDINQAKWVIRMICLFSNEEILVDLKDYFVKLVNENRTKEARYIFECLLYSKKEIAFEFIKIFKNQSALSKEKLDEYILAFSKINQIDEEVLRDQLVSDDYNQEDYNYEKQRLFNNFISGRMYSEIQFESLFLKKPLFNALAQGLVFGEYVLGKLYSAFIVEGEEKKYIIGNALENDKKQISIIHTLDLDERFEGIQRYVTNPTFNQFEKSRFNVQDFSRSAISVNCFNGMFVNLNTFAQRLEAKGFKINKFNDEIEFSSFVHILKNINICTELSLEKKAVIGQPNITLGDIHFLRLEDVLIDKDKYLTARANAISVGSLNYRYFDYVLNSIYESAHYGQEN